MNNESDVNSHLKLKRCIHKTQLNLPGIENDRRKQIYKEEIFTKN